MDKSIHHAFNDRPVKDRQDIHIFAVLNDSIISACLFLETDTMKSLSR